MTTVDAMGAVAGLRLLTTTEARAKLGREEDDEDVDFYSGLADMEDFYSDVLESAQEVEPVDLLEKMLRELEG